MVVLQVGGGVPVTPWLWLGTVGMLLGTLYFAISGWRETDERRREFYVVTGFVTAIAFINYLAMALGFGVTQVTVGGQRLPIFWARYTDWFFTTPLLLLDLGLLAGASREELAALVGLDAAMVGTGALAALTGDGAAFAGLSTGAQRILWWGVSVVLLVALLYLLYGTIGDRARRLGIAARSTFGTLRTAIVVLWLAYPVWWLLGTEGLGVFALGVEAAGFAALDLAAKVGFGLVLVSSREALTQAVRAREADGDDPTTGTAAPGVTD